MSARTVPPRAAVAAGAVLLVAAGAAAVTTGGGARAADLAGRPDSITVTVSGIPAISASSYQWAVETPVGTTGSPGRTTYAPFSFTHDVGPTSIPLAKAASTGTRLAQVTVAISAPGGGGAARPYQQFTLRDVNVTRVVQSSPDSHAAAGDVVVPPQETVTLTYRRIEQRATSANGAAAVWEGGVALPG